MVDFESPEYVKKWTREPELYWFEEMIIERFFKKTGAVLVVGCGTGRDSVPLARMGYDMVGVDVSKGMIKAAKHLHAYEKRLHFVAGDAGCLSFSDDFFDYCIISCQTINLVNDFKRVISESYRILKDEGLLSFPMHNPYSLNALWYRKEMPKHLYSYDTIRRELEKVGFKEISVNSLRTLSKPKSILSKYPFILFHHVLIFTCKK